MNWDFWPYTRFISKSAYFLNEKVTARDCRILFILSGDGEFVTDSCTYALGVNSLIYYPCGFPYHIKSEKGLIFYTLNFDFTSDYADYDVMIPEAAESFDHNKTLNTVSFAPDNNFQKTMYFEDAVWAEDIICRIYNEDLIRKAGYKEVQNSYLKILLTELYRRHSSNSPFSPLCLKIKQTVHSNLPLNIHELARLINYHPFYMNEVFKKSEGCSLHEYIMKQRLIKASQLITTTQKNLNEIAMICGFSSHSHLTTAFKKEYHITPAKLRRQI